MARKTFKTPDGYLESLPEERRAVIAAMRKLVLKNLPKGYVESINFGMLCYEVPLKRFSVTYNKQPLMYAALAANKNNYSLHLMCVYGASEPNRKLREAFEKAGKKLDMGKACIRFNKPDDLALEAIAEAIASVPVDKYIEYYEKSRSGEMKGTC
jgi:hypothetical protein